ncbi:MAG: M48 family metalloprotease [Rubrivivax sp.]
MGVERDRVLNLRKESVGWLLATSMLVACGTPVVNPVTGKTERTVMNEQEEIAAGREAHKQVLQEYGVYDKPQLQAYVSGVGNKLAKQSHRANLPWTFTVLDSAEINAFALPGGYVYITRGIMAYLESEAELAGVIGHEIGHVTARHGAQRATRGQTAGFGVLAATVLGAVLESQGFGGATDLASQASQAAAAGYIASYSREQKLQADQLGAEYLARNRYDPNNMVDVISVLKSQEQFAADTARAQGGAAAAAGQRNSWLSSHPSNDQRLQQIRQIAANYQGDYGDDGRSRYLRAIDGIAFGGSAAQGVVRGQNFYHDELGIAITAPPQWQVKNTPEAISLVSDAGDAALVVRLAPAKAGGSHEQVIRELVNPSAGRTENRDLNGLDGTHFVGTVKNKQGQDQRVELTVVTGPGGRNYLLVYAARNAAALQRASGSIRQAEASFRALTSADRQAARVWVLDTVQMPAGGFDQLARSSVLNGDKVAQLKLLNGVYGGAAAPATGQLVKIVK